MKTIDSLESIEDMAVAGKVVSKRTARAFVEPGMEMKGADGHGKTLSTTSSDYGRTASEDVETIGSTTSVTARMTSAMEGSTVIYNEAGSSQKGASTEAAPRTDRVDALPVDSEVCFNDRQLAHHVQACSNVTPPDVKLRPRSETLAQDGRPLNFGLVVPGIYRSSYPQMEHYAFLKSLGLKTVITLVRKEFPVGYKSFLNENGIKHHVFDMQGTKKAEISIETMLAILRIALDSRNHPLLIHCNHGRHRTGCVVAIMRKASGWGLSSILEEYKTYAEPKIRDCDIEYITSFNVVHLADMWAKQHSWTFRLRQFYRLTTFSFFILLLWLCTGNHMVPGKH